MKFVETYLSAVTNHNDINMCKLVMHYGDVMMSAMASHITSLTIAYSTVYSGADQRKHESSASLAFLRGNPRTKGQLHEKCFHLMTTSWILIFISLRSKCMSIELNHNIFSGGHLPQKYDNQLCRWLARLHPWFMDTETLTCLGVLWRW